MWGTSTSSPPTDPAASAAARASSVSRAMVNTIPGSTTPEVSGRSGSVRFSSVIGGLALLSCLASGRDPPKTFAPTTSERAQRFPGRSPTWAATNSQVGGAVARLLLGPGGVVHGEMGGHVELAVHRHRLEATDDGHDVTLGGLGLGVQAGVHLPIPGLDQVAAPVGLVPPAL